MVTLYSYPELFGVPDNNPFGLKVYAYLKLCGVAFRHEHIFDASSMARLEFAPTAKRSNSVGSLLRCSVHRPRNSVRRVAASRKPMKPLLECYRDSQLCRGRVHPSRARPGRRPPSRAPSAAIAGRAPARVAALPRPCGDLRLRGAAAPRERGYSSPLRSADGSAEIHPCRVSRRQAVKDCSRAETLHSGQILNVTFPPDPAVRTGCR
jgi:hypothetical protein